MQTRNRYLKYVWALFVPLYLGAIVAANLVTAHEPPLIFTWLSQEWVIPWGTWFVAATFFLRDGVQLVLGRRATCSRG